VPVHRGAGGVRPSEPRTVRVVIKKVHGNGHHGGAWKVAYADFVTTMMALFIVLWIIGQDQSVRQRIAQYFRNPGVFSEGTASTPNPAGAGLLPGDQVSTAVSGDEGQVKEDEALKAAAERFKALLAEKGLLETLRDQIAIEVTREGLRIELMERDSSPLFLVGSATLLDPLRPVLDNLGGVLAQLPNRITIEGHTDSRRYFSTPEYSNWELSTDRANGARRFLEAGSLPPGRIDRVIGHADRLLKVPDDALNAANRRITIIVRRLERVSGRGRVRALAGAGFSWCEPAAWHVPCTVHCRPRACPDLLHAGDELHGAA